MGFGDSNNDRINAGSLVNCDFDTISLSNLNRQFLFSNNDIGREKSIIAVNKIKQFYPNINFHPFNCKLDENESKTDPIILSSIENAEFILSAVDNIPARRILDQYSQMHDIVFLEGGISGVNANSSIVVPYKSITYSEVNDVIQSRSKDNRDSAKEDRSCTVKSTPYKFGHCIDWSLNLFQDIFNDRVILLCQYIKSNFSRATFDQVNLNERLRFVVFISLILQNRVEDCAEVLFNDLFYYEIDLLLNTLDKSTWTGLVNRPTGLKLIDVENRDLFVKHFKNLIESIFSPNFKNMEASYNIDLDVYINAYNSVQMPEKEKETLFEQAMQTNFELLINNGVILNCTPHSYDYEILDHLNLLYYLSIFRAKVFKIPEESLEFVKKVSGKIQPTVATSSACVVGFNCLELYKFLSNDNIDEVDTDSLRGMSMSLGSSTFNYLRLNPPRNLTISDINNEINEPFLFKDKTNVTKWTKIKLNNCTLKQMLDHIKDNFEYPILYLKCMDQIIFHARNSDDKNLFDIEICDLLSKKE